MIRIGQLKLEPNHSDKDLLQKIAKSLRVSESDILSYSIQKQSIDARKKPELKYVYTVDVNALNENRIMKKNKDKNINLAKEIKYSFDVTGTTVLSNRPVIIGSGPAGLFCAYILAEHGYRPLLFERGACVEERMKDINEFWETGVLNTESNVQFGEGGAGTFSDGKLNTVVKDPVGRGKKVLQIFVDNGAPEDILYASKPHIGTDILVDVVRNMREQIIAWGGEICFHSKFTDFTMKNDKITSIKIETSEGSYEVATEVLVLAIGHSARDTFKMLYEKAIPMSAKSFAVGVRVEHEQVMINESQYGMDCPYEMPAAPYKVTANLENGRGVYSFCMCPGGYVVNASSEEGHTAVNGMSYRARAGKNANSAIIVSVSPEDFKSEHPLAGIEFQRKLEKAAYELGKGKIPVQRFEDYCKNKVSDAFGKVIPQMKGSYTFANVREIFPKVIGDSIEVGIRSFERQIQGYSDADTLLSGVESRTSSPVRIPRNEFFQIEETGIYPCGEGAGYAGGITSAAMDGLKVAEMIAKKFVAFDK